MRAAKLLSLLSTALKGSNKITYGSSQFTGWVRDLVSTCLSDIGLPAFGAILVPQMGEGAGIPVGVTFNTSELPTPQAQEALLTAQRVWENLQVKHENTATEVVKGHRLVASMIAHHFDRPIGMLWALSTPEQSCAVLEKIQDVGILISTAVFAEKLTRSLRSLAEHCWYGSTTQLIFENVLKLCVSTLDCAAGIGWELDTRKNMLMTRATAGSASGLSVDILVGEGLAGICCQTGEERIIDDLNAENVANKIVVAEHSWKSAIMLPLDLGGTTAGVLAVYAVRKYAFSTLDKTIATAFAQRLAAGYLFAKRIEELEDKQERVLKESSAIEAGLLAMQVVHDINDQIGFSQGYLSEILSRYKRDTQHFAYTRAKISTDYLEKAATLLKTMTTRSKLTSCHKKEEDLAVFLRTLKKEIETDLEKAKIDCRISVPGKLPVLMDQAQIRRVFDNLIKNAMYFLKTVRRQKKTIEIEARLIDKGVQVLITDNGPGISPYEIEKVFDVFFTTKGEQGMGLGLAISKRIIELHGGKIGVRSQWGQWTEFKLILPSEVSL